MIPSVNIPPGTPFSGRESIANRALLVANGYQATPIGYRRATGSDEPVLRAAGFQLLAGDPVEDNLVVFEQGVADPDPTVRAFAAFGLEQLRPSRGAQLLRELAAPAPEFGQYAPLIAAALLARLGDPSGFATVQRAMTELGEPPPVVARLFPFACLGVPGIWALYGQALASADMVIREQVMAQLRELGSPAAAPVLEQLIASLPDEDAWKTTARDLLHELTVPR